MDGSQFRFDTPEQVTLSFDIAGLGSRGLALALDMIIQGAAFFALFLGIWGDLSGEVGSAFGSLYAGFLILSIALLFFVYFIVFEGILHGRTPGKMALRIRVVTRDGRPLTWGGAVVRNLFRLLDFLPILYGVGIAAVFADKHSRRVGDMVAGTLVIHDRKAKRPTVDEESPDPVSGFLGGTLGGSAWAGTSTEPGYASTQSLYPLTRKEFLLLRDLFSRQKKMNRRAFERLCDLLAEPLFERFQIPPAHRREASRFLWMLFTENERRHLDGV